MLKNKQQFNGKLYAWISTRFSICKLKACIGIERY